MEPEQRGRASRASSTSSLGREVRCGCQYYQSDSLLPERRALLGRPPSRTMQQPPAVRCSEHEYEPIAVPSPLPKPATAPVVRITDTDVVHVADSDDSIDDRSRLPPELTRDGDVVLPLDGKIEDSAMEGRELGETGDTSEEIETPQQLQERLEERFLSSATPGAESRTDGEVNTSQVDSLALEELPLRRGARGLPQRLKTQAGKLRTRLRNIQRPTFAFTERQKTEKSRSSSGTRSDRSRGEKRPSRMDRIRTSISEKTKFNLPNRPRFSLPDRSSFHLPERPKFQLPEKAKFSMKKPNIRLPNALTRNAKKTGPADEQRSSEATIGSKKNIFDFSTYPRIFDKKSKSRGEYATSTPKDSRAQSAESGTYPGARKRSEKWKERFERTSAYIGEDPSNGETAVERSQPWRHPSMEAPRLSISEQGTTSIPWEEKMRDEEEMQYMDYEQESPESSEQARPRSKASRTDGESYDRDRMEAEEELYQRRGRGQRVDDRETWNPEEEMTKDTLRSIQRSRSLEEVLRSREEERYDETFAMVDPRRYGVHKTPSEEEEYDEEMDEEDEEREPSSAQSDREQQHSSTSSCDRRRRGVIEEIDSDEFFLRESGLSQEDMNLGKYLTSEIRDALRTDAGNVLADDDMVPIPPQRPKRTRSLRKQREGSVESYDAAPPVRPKRDPNKIRRSESTDEQFHERTRSDSKHRIVYQTEGEPAVLPVELLDDIVVVKPIRRKSRSSQRSQSQAPEEIPRPISPIPPAVPKRRKRCRKETNERNDNINPICNGHPESPPLAPSMIEGQSRKTKVYEAEEILTNSEENIEKLVTRLREEKEEQEEGYMHPVPVPPKRRSRSRGTSVAQDEDRTSHGAESLPEAGYMEEEIPPDDVDYGKDLTGYAIIEKREKPPRPPPPRRRKDKYATAPRSTPPRRPQRAYSTLKPQRSKESSILSDNYDTTLQPSGSTPYIEIDSDDGEHKNLRSDEVLSKMQRRPLPAPPRPPRVRKDRSQERVPTEMQQEIGMEITTATQTDPLPDDMIIEEVTQAKLIVAPSRSGSQIMVSTERIPSPSSMSTPPVPPLPMPQRSHKEEKMEAAYDTVSLKSPSPEREIQVYEDRHLSAPHLQESRNDDDTHLRSVRAALYSDEPVKIQNLEVGDLRVDRLSVSQIEAGKIIASEVDALVISASELKGISGGIEESLSPSIIKELIAIRSHLETVAASRTREVDRTESMAVVESVKRSDIPVAEKQIEKEEVTADRGASTEEEKEKKLEQKVVKRVVTEGKDIENTHTLSVARVEDRETIRTLENSRIESGDNDISSTRTPFHVQSIQDKSLRILDTESLVSLSPGTATELVVEESRTSLPTSATTTMEETHESRLSPEPFPEAGNDLRDVTSLDSKSASLERKSKESSPDSGEGKTRRSRSRSSSPISMSRTRQTASPVRSLPPAISVTPDTPDSVASHGITSEMQPQRAVISYTTCTEQSDRESQRESSQSPTPSSFPLTGTHLIAFPASQIPQQFLSLANQRVDGEPSIADSTRQLVRVLRVASLNAIRHFVSYVTSIVGEESREKIREVELTLCALLVLIAGLLIFFFTYPRTVTHHHHWDYFNPPK